MPKRFVAFLCCCFYVFSCSNFKRQTVSCSVSGCFRQGLRQPERITTRHLVGTSGSFGSPRPRTNGGGRVCPSLPILKICWICHVCHVSLNLETLRCDALFFHGDLENFGMPFERTHTNSRYGRSACKVGVQASKRILACVIGKRQFLFFFQSTLIINCILFVTQTLLQCLEVLKSSNSTQRLAALSISNRTGQVYLFASRTALLEFLLKLQTYMPVNTMKFASCEQHKCLENTYATTRPPTNGRPCSLDPCVN